MSWKAGDEFGISSLLTNQREKEKRKTKRKQLSTPEKTKVAKENKQSQCCCALQYLPCCNI